MQQELKYTQNRVEAKTKEIDTENHLKALAEREMVSRGDDDDWGDHALARGAVMFSNDDDWGDRSCTRGSDV